MPDTPDRFLLRTVLKRTAKEWESSHDSLVTGLRDKERNHVN